MCVHVCAHVHCRLHYDNVTKTYHNTDGVQTRIPGFGNTSGIEYLDPNSKLGSTIYFHPMVSYKYIQWNVV